MTQIIDNSRNRIYKVYQAVALNLVTEYNTLSVAEYIDRYVNSNPHPLSLDALAGALKYFMNDIMAVDPSAPGGNTLLYARVQETEALDRLLKAVEAEITREGLLGQADSAVYSEISTNLKTALLPLTSGNPTADQLASAIYENVISANVNSKDQTICQADILADIIANTAQTALQLATIIHDNLVNINDVYQLKKAIYDNGLFVDAPANQDQLIHSVKLSNDLTTIGYYSEIGAPITNIIGTQLSAGAAVAGTQLSTGAMIAGTQLSTGADIIGTQLSTGAMIDGTQLSTGANLVGTQLSTGADIVGTQLSSGAMIDGTQLSTGADIVGTQLSMGAMIDGTQLSTGANIVGTQLSTGANLVGTQLSTGADIVGTQLSSGAMIDGTQLSTGANLVGTQLSTGAHIAGTQLAPFFPTFTPHSFWRCGSVDTDGGLPALIATGSATDPIAMQLAQIHCAQAAFNSHSSFTHYYYTYSFADEFPTCCGGDPSDLYFASSTDVLLGCIAIITSNYLPTLPTCGS